jgi:hypothetical protein
MGHGEQIWVNQKHKWGRNDKTFKNDDFFCHSFVSGSPFDPKTIAHVHLQTGL